MASNFTHFQIGNCLIQCSSTLCCTMPFSPWETTQQKLNKLSKIMGHCCSLGNAYNLAFFASRVESLCNSKWAHLFLWHNKFIHFHCTLTKMKHVLLLLHKFGDEPTFHNLRPSDTNLARLVVCQRKAGVIIHNLHLRIAHHCSTWTWFHWEWSLCKCQTHSKHWTSFCHSITLQTPKKNKTPHLI